MKKGVIIVAGGSGHRMGGHIPKQYLDLAGKPVIVRTLDRFFDFDPQMKIVLVLAKGHMEFWNTISKNYNYGSRIDVAQGGESRYRSVKNGLQLMGDGLMLGIHDAVRPLVSHHTLKQCYEIAAEKGSCIPVTDMDETVRMVREQGHSEHLDRSILRRVQTPQVFKSELIRKAYDQPCKPAFTDDASVFESIYGEVSMVEGNRENIKITTPIDLQLAALLIRSVE
jgi:2-C-methyl-D-erythritol 4-phosphate cytidylyltransferase